MEYVKKSLSAGPAARTGAAGCRSPRHSAASDDVWTLVAARDGQHWHAPVTGVAPCPQAPAVVMSTEVDPRCLLAHQRPPAPSYRRSRGPPPAMRGTASG